MIPKGSIIVTLGEIIEPSKERTDPNKMDYPVYVGLEHIEKGTGKLLSFGDSSQIKSTKSNFYTGDLLYGKLRPNLNKVWLADRNGICSTDILVFPHGDRLSNKFLFYRLLSHDFVKYASQNASGVELPRVSYKNIAKFPIILPPLPEQHRIVAKIEELFTQLDAGVAALTTALAQLEYYRKSILKAAVEGCLTEEWRRSHGTTESANALLNSVLKRKYDSWQRDQFNKFIKKGIRPKDERWKLKYQSPQSPEIVNYPDLPKGWTWVSWDQIGYSQNGRSFPSKEYQSNGIKLLRPGNLYKNGSVSWNEDNTRYLPEIYAKESPEYIIKSNEIVMNLTAQSLKDEFLGRVCLTSEGEYCLLNQRIARLTPLDVSKRYLFWLFKSNIFRTFVNGLNTGSLIQHMFTSQLKEFILPLPPLAEQHAIVNEIERRFTIIDETEKTIQQSLAQAERLRQSILKRAFEGKLVPQDPRDEPASLLLERIKKEKAAAKTQKKTTRSGKSKTTQQGLI